jgi:hypothetical protein
MSKSKVLVKQLPSSDRPPENTGYTPRSKRSGSPPSPEGLIIQDMVEKLDGQPPVAKGKQWFRFHP